MPDPQNPQATTDTSLSTRQKLAALLPLIGKIFPQQGSGQGGVQPQGGGVPATVGTPAYPTPPPGMGSPGQGLNIQTDPRASVGSLPMPQPRPAAEPLYNRTSGDDIYQSSLTPKNQATFNAIQGASQFVQNWMQKRDKEQHSEAANAAQSLMQAINSGDYVAANDIIHQNEKLFNKVYKGWLTKAQEAKTPKKEKPVDPDVQGFEQGIQKYFSGQGGQGQGQGQGQQQPPQPPRTIGQSKSAPGGYYLPKASPAEMLQKQATSSEAQAMQQDPARGLQSQLMSPEQRAAELSKAGFIATPEDQAKYTETYQKLQQSQNDVTSSQLAVQIAQLTLQQKKLEGDTNIAKWQKDLDLAQDKITMQSFETDRYKTMLEIQNLKLSQGGTIPASVKTKFGAIQQAKQILSSAVDGKLSTQQIQSLQVQLQAGGMASAAKAIGDWKQRWFSGAGDPASLLDSVSAQEDALSSEFPGLTTQPNQNGVIVVKPEDMK